MEAILEIVIEESSLRNRVRFIVLSDFDRARREEMTVTIWTNQLKDAVTITYQSFFIKRAKEYLVRSWFNKKIKALEKILQK